MQASLIKEIKEALGERILTKKDTELKEQVDKISSRINDPSTSDQKQNQLRQILTFGLCTAAENANVTALFMLARGGAYVAWAAENKELLHCLVELDQPATLGDLVEEFKLPMSVCNKKGFNLLHTAVQHRKPDVVDLLLKYPFFKEAKNLNRTVTVAESKKTAFVLAAEQYIEATGKNQPTSQETMLKIMRQLIIAGADLNISQMKDYAACRPTIDGVIALLRQEIYNPPPSAPLEVKQQPVLAHATNPKLEQYSSLYGDGSRTHSSAHVLFPHKKTQDGRRKDDYELLIEEQPQNNEAQDCCTKCVLS